MNNKLMDDASETELKVALVRARDWGEVQRQLNLALEERIDLKERRIAHLEDDNRELNSRLETQAQLLEMKRSMIVALRQRNSQLEVTHDDLKREMQEMMMELADAKKSLRSLTLPTTVGVVMVKHDASSV